MIQGSRARHFPNDGRLDWIGVRPQARAAMVEVDEAQALAERGLTTVRFADNAAKSDDA